MAVVVDASALGAMTFGEPDAAALSAHLEGETLIAPTLVDYELANIALKKVRRGLVTPAQASVLLTAALRVPIQRLPVPGEEVFELARQTGLTTYDASYLWLARAHDAELVTLDRPLAEITDTLGGPGASYRTP
jgi:predicted nucleic acid-binding protein